MAGIAADQMAQESIRFLQIETAHGMAAFGQWARSIAQRSLDDDSGNDIVSEAVRNLRALGVMDSDPGERLWLDSYTLNVVMAGHETTVNTTAGGLVSLLRSPEQWDAVVEAPGLIPNAVDEMLGSGFMYESIGRSTTKG